MAVHCRHRIIGHHTESARQRLEAIGARVLRTDLDGQITLETDGSQIHFRIFREARGE